MKLATHVLFVLIIAGILGVPFRVACVTALVGGLISWVSLGMSRAGLDVK